VTVDTSSVETLIPSPTPVLLPTIQIPTICFEGPGEEYKPTSENIDPGTQIKILGINSQGKDWLKIQVGEVVTNSSCWIRRGDIVPGFDVNLVSLVHTLVAKHGTVCNSGPNAVYNIIRVYINLNDELIIQSKSKDQKWVEVPYTPDFPNPCWVELEKFVYDPTVLPSIVFGVEPPFDATIGGGNDKGGGNDGGGDGEDGGGGGVPGTGGGTNQTNTPVPDRPECSDGIDNDNDGAIDYGLDWGCNNDNDDSEDTVPQPP